MVDLIELQGLETALQNGDATAWMIGFLWVQMDLLGRDLAVLVSEVALPLLGPFVYLLLTWYALRIIMLWGTPIELLREIGKVVFFTMVALSVLMNPHVIFDWVITPLLNAGANLAELILWHTLSPKMRVAIEAGAFSTSPGIEGNAVAEMVWLVDRQIDWVILLAYRILQSDSGVMYVLNFGPRLAAAIPLLFLSVGLLGLYVAYTAEALFNFLVGAVMTPLVVVGFVVPKGRAYAGATFRILIAGAFTIVMLSIAMGFTGRIVSILEPALAGELTGQQASHIAALQSGVVDACSAQRGSQNQNCIEAKDALAQVQDADSISVFGPAYTLLMVLLILSIILHMKAKTIAGNLTGVNDGPGPAATVVGLATAGAGAVLGATKWAAAKSAPGIAKGAENLSRRMPFSGGNASTGSEGGATSRRVPSGSASDQSNMQNPSNSPPSGGSGTGGADLSQLNKNLENLIKSLNKKGGGG